MQKPIVLSLFLLFSIFGLAQVQTGKASFYGDKFEGRKTASGVKYYHAKPTAAHKYLPFGTKVRVTNLANNKSTIVEINDRGPFITGRIIDLSKSSAKKLGFINSGVTDVVIEILDDEYEAVAATNESDNVENTTAVQFSDTIADVEPLEFYNLDITKIEPDWLGVQIGSFEELANLIPLADHLKINYQKEITVQVKTIQDIKVYSLVVGKFNSKERAEKFKTEIAIKYPGSFIVDFSKF